MDGVVHTSTTTPLWLLDAGELRQVLEHVHAATTIWRLHDPFIFAIAGESSIQDLLDIIKVLLRLTIRVQIQGLRKLRRHAYECAVVLSAQKNSNGML